MADARDVARFLIGVGFDPAAPDESVLVCPLRLQKLLYYCQGWCLALLDRPLFAQPIEAWTNGPVVKDVYQLFAGQRCGITPDVAGEPTAPLTATEAALVRMVWSEYARHTPGELVRMTHEEPAWKEARGDLPPEAHSSAPLSTDTMTRHFSEAARRTARPGFDPVADWRADEQWERAGWPTISADDLHVELFGEPIR
jgi:uncharacterized phage-associated protein